MYKNKGKIVFKGKDALIFQLLQKYCKTIEIFEVCLYVEQKVVIRKEIMDILQKSEMFSALYDPTDEEDEFEEDEYNEKMEEEFDNEQKFDKIETKSQLIKIDSKNKFIAISKKFLLQNQWKY